MPAPDDDLLARLNTLKKSHVSMSTTPNIYVPATEPVADEEPITDLAVRFRRLGGAGASAHATPTKAALDVGRPLGDDAEHNVEDDRTLDELLEELGPVQEWNVSKEDEKEVGKLVAEARRILPMVQQAPQAVGRNKEHGDAHQVPESGNEQASEGSDTRDEQEAEDYVAKILAELELEKKYDKKDPESDKEDDADEHAEGKDAMTHGKPATTEFSSDNDDGDHSASLDLPAAPTTQPTSPSMPDDFERATAFDDILTSRMAALSLPSAPSFAPGNKPVKITKAQPKFTDEEIDSWCIICNDDAAVKCLGCDGDLYCWNCWKEGHTGPDAGYEERGHKWVKYVFKKG